MKKVYIACIILSLIFLCNLNAQVQTVGLFTHQSGSEDDGYVLFAPFTSDTTFLIDKCGRLVHKWGSAYTPGLDAYILPDGSLLRAGHYPNIVFDQSAGSEGGIIERYDWNGNLLWHYVVCNATETQNHDIYPMPNGNILLAVWEVISDSEALASGRDPSNLGSSLWSGKIIELEPVGTDSAIIVWQWRFWDHLVQDYDSAKPNYGVVADHPELLNLNYANISFYGPAYTDWLHLNQVTYNPKLDQIMISSHNLSEIYILDHSTTISQAATHTGGTHNKGGDFLYRWGNPAAYNRGVLADEKLFQQHDPTWITIGKYANQILIFNNGLGRPGGNASSVDIINPPVDSFGNYALTSGQAYEPDSLAWTYQSTNPGSFFSAYMGGAQILPNGNILISEAMEGNLFEIDSSKNIVWKYIDPIEGNLRLSQDSEVTYSENATYRCTFYPSSYSGFAGLNLSRGTAPIEQNPLAYSCDLNTGIASINLNTEVAQIFPNPADTKVTIKMGDLNSIIINDITGRKIVNKKLAHTNEAFINTSDLPSGIYILCVNGSQNRKIVVKH